MGMMPYNTAASMAAHCIDTPQFREFLCTKLSIPFSG
jgi:hypothetical protein